MIRSKHNSWLVLWRVPWQPLLEPIPIYVYVHCVHTSFCHGSWNPHSHLVAKCLFAVHMFVFCCIIYYYLFLRPMFFSVPVVGVAVVVVVSALVIADIVVPALVAYDVASDVLFLVVSVLLHCYLLATADCMVSSRGLQSLTFGSEYNLELPSGKFPYGLRYLRFGSRFNRSLEYAELPDSIQTLIFGEAYNQSLDKVKLPSSLVSLTFGHWFNQSLEHVELPSKLEHLSLGAGYRHSLDNVKFPSTLRTLEGRGIMVSSV